jgi:aldehyde dehydrogenase (NAD+)
LLTRLRLDEFFPHSPHPRSFLKNEITADIHTERDFKRHSEALDQAEKNGDLLYRAEADSATRRMGISLVRQHETSTGALVENEIFGPVLPIIAVKVRSDRSSRQCVLIIQNVDAAIQYINDRPKPLALYVLSGKKAVFDRGRSHAISLGPALITSYTGDHEWFRYLE